MSGEQDDPWSEIEQRGSVALALAFARLFWPRFVERRGCVLLESRADDEAIADWLDHSNGDCRVVEAMLNHVHLWDEIPEAAELDEQAENGAVMEVGHMITHCWRAALADQFPDREFKITLAASDADYGPTIYVTSAT